MSTIVGTYKHHNRGLGALVRVEFEDPLAARTEMGHALADELALHVAGTENPSLDDEHVRSSETLTGMVARVAGELGCEVRVAEFVRLSADGMLARSL